jgi:hypothetical protein
MVAPALRFLQIAGGGCINQRVAEVINLSDPRLSKRDLHLLREIATRLEHAAPRPKPTDDFIPNVGLYAVADAEKKR